MLDIAVIASLDNVVTGGIVSPVSLCAYVIMANVVLMTLIVAGTTIEAILSTLQVSVSGQIFVK